MVREEKSSVETNESMKVVLIYPLLYYDLLSTQCLALQCKLEGAESYQRMNSLNLINEINRQKDNETMIQI